jgi:hypothetical protein
VPHISLSRAHGKREDPKKRRSEEKTAWIGVIIG